MIIDTGGRQSGKSTKAVEWALRAPEQRAIVTFNFQSVKYLHDMGKERGADLCVLSWTDYQRGVLAGLGKREVYVDELLMCISSGGHPIVGFSL